LRAESIGSEPNQGPWITDLVVEKSRRGNGIGTALISALEMEARRFRHQFIYTSTYIAGDILLSRGWQEINKITSHQRVATIYRAELQKSTTKLT
jgi:GNAT superfamily N-acetyltransferase